jgi:thiamine-phosphate pyrophosphorylase
MSAELQSRTADPRSWGLYLVTDRAQTRNRPLEAVIDAALQGGVKAVQLREKDLSGLELYRLAERLLPLVHRYGASLLVNDRLDLALVLPLDGVHLAQASLPPADARTLLGAGRLIGVSCHTEAEALEAQQGGADFIVFGPLYQTPSKQMYGPPVGLEALRQLHRKVTLPIFGIGGIRLSRVAAVIASGAQGVAVVSAVMTADDPARAARDLLGATRAALWGTQARG